MNTAPLKPHTAGILAALVTVAGALAEPSVLGLLPGKWATVIVAVGAVLQAITKAVQHGDTDVVPKS